MVSTDYYFCDEGSNMHTQIWTQEAYKKMLEKEDSQDGDISAGSPELPKTVEVGKMFMTGGVEYITTFYNEKNNTYSIQPVETKAISVRLNEVLNINQLIYKIIYINHGQRRITIKQRI